MSTRVRQGAGAARSWLVTKTNAGNFFEDFTVGQVIEHATPRTITEGDRALYGALYPTPVRAPVAAPSSPPQCRPRASTRSRS